MDTSDKNLYLQLKRTDLVDQVFRTMFICALMMAAMDIFLNYFPGQLFGRELNMIRKCFNITREDSIQNWYSATLTFFNAVVLFFITRVIWQKNNKINFDIVMWAGLAFFFAFMAFDDAAVFHERFGSSLKKYTSTSIKGVPSYNWHANVAPVFMIIGLIVSIFLYRVVNNLKSKKLLFFGFFMLLVALVFDFVEGLDLRGFDHYHVKHFLKLFEEMIEMMAMGSILSAFLGVLLDQIDTVQLELK